VSKISSDHGVKVIDPSLNFKNFGGQSEFCGSIVTIKAYESNPLVRATLQEDGNGRVLVVDAGGSTRCAMLGGNLAEIGEKNGWAGIVVYGCIRDSKEISNICIGVKALNTHPVKSHKDEKGVRYCLVSAMIAKLNQDDETFFLGMCLCTLVESRSVLEITCIRTLMEY